jgi:hypothetical protein
LSAGHAVLETGTSDPGDKRTQQKPKTPGLSFKNLSSSLVRTCSSLGFEFTAALHLPGELVNLYMLSSPNPAFVICELAFNLKTKLPVSFLTDVMLFSAPLQEYKLSFTTR